MGDPRLERATNHRMCAAVKVGSIVKRACVQDSWHVLVGIESLGCDTSHCDLKAIQFIRLQDVPIEV